MKGKMNCAIYTRVSTDNQAEKEFNSCEAQRDRIEHFIKSQIGFTVYDVFNDEGFSGKDLNRPELQRMINEIAKGNVDCVLTYKMDRLTRSPKDFYHLIEYFEKYKVDFISVTERFDTSTPSGRLLRNIMLTFAQFERELASERTKDKLLQRAEKGMWNGGTVPYGYNRENKKLVINDKEAAVVRKIYGIYIKTGSVSQIYKYLKKNDIKNKNGRIFTKTYIPYILRNIVYIGKIKYGKKIHKGIHEAIITEDVFKLTQTLHKASPILMRKYKEYLFGGLVVCRECGSIMTSCYTSKKIKGKKKRYYYYRCTSTLHKDWNACSIKQVNSKKLEDFVFDTLRKIIMDNYYIESILNRAKDLVNKSSFSEHREHEVTRRLGFRKHRDCFEVNPDLFRRSLERIIIAAEKSAPSETREMIKNSMQSIQYSKDEIVINVYYEATSDNKENDLGHVAGESTAHTQMECAKPMDNSTLDTQKNGLKYMKNAGDVGDGPRRSAPLKRGRGAEGYPPSVAKSSVRETGRWGDAKRGIGDIKKTRSSQFSLEQPGSYPRSGSRWKIEEHLQSVFQICYTRNR